MKLQVLDEEIADIQRLIDQLEAGNVDYNTARSLSQVHAQLLVRIHKFLEIFTPSKLRDKLVTSCVEIGLVGGSEESEGQEHLWSIWESYKAGKINEEEFDDSLVIYTKKAEKVGILISSLTDKLNPQGHSVNSREAGT